MGTPEEIATSFAGKVLNYVLGKVWKACTDINNYRRNIASLQDEVEELKAAKGTVELNVAAANRERKIITPTTDKWKSKFSSIDKDASDVLERAEKLNHGCCQGRWNLKQRLSLSRGALMLTKDAKEHTGKIPLVIAVDPLPAGMLRAVTAEDSEVLISQKAIIEEVMTDLEKNKNCVIGICGMPGVGKNWLVRRIRNRWLEGQGRQAPMVVVSERKLYDIQQALAQELGLPLASTDTGGREQELHGIFSKSEESILVILDKVYESFKLSDIGIPRGDSHKGLKVVFTSEMNKDSNIPIIADKYIPVDILPREDAWILFKRCAGDCVETEELRSIAEDVFNECGRLPIAITILGIGLRNKMPYDWNNARRELQNSTVKSLHGIRENVYKPIQTSCKLLGSRQPQALHLLMLCCLFPKDTNISVEKLIRYANGLPEFEDAENLKATTDKVMSLVDELMNCSLLLSGDKEKTVKMHNVVRNVCLLIASENRLEFDNKYDYMVKHHPEFKEWPQKVEQISYNAISLTLTSEDQTQLQLPGGLNYPDLELLQLHFHCDSVNIPEDFFWRMNKVRVIDFKQVSRWGGSLRIGRALPPMVKNHLALLQTLSLEFCEVSPEDLALITGLKNLEILSFFSSKLKELPSEMRDLSNLKLLDLRCADGPKIIPSGTLSALKNLEDLYLGNYDSWSKDSEQKSSSSIQELSFMKFLKTLQVRVKSPPLLLQLKDSVSMGKLERYQIDSKGAVVKFPEYEIGKSLSIDRADWSKLLDPKMCVLLTSCESLALRSTKFTDLFSVCTNLKTLTVYRCEEVEFIFDKRDSAPSLNKLKHMSVTYLDNLTELCKGNLPAASLVELEIIELKSLPELTHLWRAPIIQPPCLGNLKEIKIEFCDAITSFFPMSVAKCLVELQKLIVQNCFKLEGILSNEGAAEKIVFPKLSFLSLEDLPSFRSFLTVKVMNGSVRSAVEPDKWTSEITTIHSSESNSAKPGGLADLEDNDDGAVQYLFNPLVEFPSMNKLMVRSMNKLKNLFVNGVTHGKSISKLRVVRVDGCEKLLNLVSSDSISLLQCLEKVEVQKCQSLKEVFDFKGFKSKRIENLSSDSTLGRLDTVSLHNLNKLEHIWSMVPEGVQGFGNLRSLEISGCCSLTYIFPVSVSKMLKSLQQLQVNGCAKVVEIIEIDRGCESTDVIQFPQLNNLQLDGLDCLMSFSSGNHEFEFPSLRELVINRCPRMKTFCWGEGLRGLQKELVSKAMAANLWDPESII